MIVLVEEDEEQGIMANYGERWWCGGGFLELLVNSTLVAMRGFSSALHPARCTN